MLYQQVDHCRACGSSDIPTVLDLGMFFISDFEDSPDAFIDKAPLELVRCEGCTLVQLRHTVDRDRLYRRYWYRSGTQPAMVRALREVVDEATRRVALRPGDVVIDIGANDGTLLSMYPEGVLKIGVEPSETFTGPPDTLWLRNYWPVRTTTRMAKVITSLACFYDAPDPGAFVEGIKANLADDGVWINQMAYLPETLRTGNFGDICHEHLTYWTVLAFDAVLAAHGLEIRDHSFNDVNGGSVRFVVGHGEHRTQVVSGLSPADFERLRERMFWQAATLENTLVHALNRNETVVGYGASTKGNSYLQYWNFGTDMLEFIADRNPDKWGKYTPTGQKVISEEEMRAMKPAYLLCLPWHFAEAFIERERDLLNAGAKMILPFPELRIIGGESVAHVSAQATLSNLRAAV